MSLKGDLSKDDATNKPWQKENDSEHNANYVQTFTSDNCENKGHFAERHTREVSPAWKYVALTVGVIFAAVLLIFLLSGVQKSRGEVSLAQDDASDKSSYVDSSPLPALDNGNDTATAEKLNASVFNGNLSDYSQRLFTRAEATSMAGTYDGSTFYYPNYVCDGKVSTSWQEGADGYGVGEALLLNFNSEQEIEVLSFVMGSHTDTNYYEENGKPRKLHFDFSDNSSFTYEFPQVSEQYTIKLSRPVNTSWICITIESTYPGTKFEDTAIAEIAAFGKGQSDYRPYCETDTEYFSDGTVSKITYSYPSDGVAIIKEYYQGGVEKKVSEYYSKDSYEITEYNRDGTISSYLSRWLDSNNGAVIIEKESYEYRDGVLIKEVVEQHGETWISEYNLDGKMVRSTNIDINGNKTVKEY